MTEYGSFTGRVDENVPDSPSGNGFSFWRKKKVLPRPCKYESNLTYRSKKKKKKSRTREAVGFVIPTSLHLVGALWI